MLLRLRMLVISLILLSNASFAFKLPKIQFWKTQTGVPVYFIQRNHAPMLSVRVLFKAGSAYDGKQIGLASLTNSFIGLGTSNLTPTLASQSIDNVGAELSSDVDIDGAWVDMKLLTHAPYLDKSIHLLQQLLSDPRWSQATLSLAKNGLLTQILQNNQDPTAVSLKRMMQLLYGNQPYAHPSNGTISSVKALSLASVKAFYARYYVRQNASIVMVGDLSKAKAEKISNDVAQSLQPGKSANVLPRVVPPTPLPQVAHQPFQSVQSVVMLGQLGITIRSPDRYALSMATAILGQLPLTSILFQVIREQAGLAYSPMATLGISAKQGPFLVLFNTRANETHRAVKLLKETIANYIAKGPTEAQVTLAREFLLGKFKTQLISNEDLVNLLYTMALYNRPLDTLHKAMHAYQSLTRQQITRVIQKHLSMQKMILLTVGQVPSHGS